LPGLRTLVLHGKDRHEVADDMASTTSSSHPTRCCSATGALAGRKWHLVVLDEAQNIKNANTHAAQVVGQLQDAPPAVPVGHAHGKPPGRNLEPVPLFDARLSGQPAALQGTVSHPIEARGRPERLMQLRARITPFHAAPYQGAGGHELPPKVETVMRVELSGKQADLYETIRLGMEKPCARRSTTKGLAKSQITILDALLKLRQVCCDPHLVKLDAAKRSRPRPSWSS
jgi:hypothetical protein